MTPMRQIQRHRRTPTGPVDPDLVPLQHRYGMGCATSPGCGVLVVVLAVASFLAGLTRVLPAGPPGP